MTREEAINEIKSWAIPSEKGREVLETLIPELAESEDERIRKAIVGLIEELQRSDKYFAGVELTDMLAYLEKQKDLNKMIVVSPEVWDTAIADAYENGKKDGEKQKEKKEIPLMGGDTDTYFDDLRITTKPLTSREWFDEGIKYAQRLQKEQKPEHFELKAGKWYICHRAFCCRADHLTVKEGERFMCEKDGVVKGFVIKEPEKYFKECSAPAPMEDEQKEPHYTKRNALFDKCVENCDPEVIKKVSDEVDGMLEKEQN